MPSNYNKPIPNIDQAHSKPFWDAAKRRQLVLQKCSGCGYVRHPASSLCPECLAENNEWATLSGLGEIWSFGIYHHLYNAAFRDDIPYNVAVIKLEEGPLIVSNMVNIANENIQIGMRVKVTFENVTDAISLPKFEPR